MSLLVWAFPFDSYAQSGLKAGWGFEDGSGTAAVDSSGNGNTGLLRNGPTWSTGRFGTGLTFDGVNDFIEVPDAETLDASTAVTVSAWIKPDNLNPRVLLTKEVESGGWSYGFQFLESGQLQWVVQRAGGFSVVAIVPLLPTGQWSHVAGTYDGTQIQVYLNGVLQGSAPASGPLVTGNRPLWIGTSLWQSSFFAGVVDEIRIYDRALSPSEIHNEVTLAVDPTAPLQVTAFTPANGAVGLRMVSITAALSSPMNTASLTASTVLLEPLGGAAVPATVSYASATRTITLTPSASLAALTSYRVTLKGGATGVAGTGGATLPADVAWTFTTAADGVAAFWGFEDGSGTAAVDSSGNGNTGLLRNGPTWTTGRFGTGLSFGGANDYVEVPDAETLDASTAVTVSAWIKPDNRAGVILTKEVESGLWSYGLQFLESGQVQWVVQRAGGFSVIAIGPLLPIGQWSHVAGTYDGTHLHIYLNGVLQGSEPASGLLVTGNRPLWIGTDRWLSGQFAGALDEIRIYDRALNATEISELVNTPIAGVPTTPTIDPPTGSYFTAQTVTLSSSGAPSIIRYTLDGTDPTSTSTPYNAPFAVSATTTIKARAFPIGGWTPSSVASATLTISTTLDPPIATPSAGVFAESQQVSLSAAPGATIRFTTNGSDPTETSTIYTAPISVASGTVLIKAKAFHPSLDPSSVLSATYTIDTAAPTITPQFAPGLISSWSRTPVTVTFHCFDDVQVVSCSPPVTVTQEGAGQNVSGTAIDAAGHETQLPISLNLDFAPPAVSITTPVDGLVTPNATLAITGQAADSLSGLAAVTCNGVAATMNNGALSCSVTLRPGRNVVVVAARDVAGNSASSGLTVTLGGTVTQLTMTPSERTMLVGEIGILSLRDNFGVAPTNPTWGTTNSAVVSLSADNPPVLTALSAGTAIIFASESGLAASALVTVVVGETLADGEVRLPSGTTRWKLPTIMSSQSMRTAPIYANRRETGGPDLFTVEPNAALTEYTVRALTADGAVLWKEAAPGLPLMGDSYGAAVAGVPGEYRCALYFGEDRFCFKAFVRFGGLASALPWRYDSAGYLDRPAQSPDGTIYAIEHVNGSRGFGAGPDAGNNKSVVILDGANGTVVKRVTLPTEYSRTPCGFSENEPQTVGPIVGSNGHAYLLVHRSAREAIGTCNNPITVFSDEGWTLLDLTREGHVGSIGVVQSPFAPEQLLPDGAGGLLIRVRRTFGSPAEAKLVRFDEQWQRSEFGIALNTRIDLVGERGTVYLQSRTGSDNLYGITEALNVVTGALLWTASPGWNLVAAKPNGGGTALGTAGELMSINATGQMEGTTAFGLARPVLVAGGVIGQGTSTGELKAVAFDSPDATRWSATLTRVSFATYEPSAFGTQIGQLAPQLIFHTNYNAMEIETNLSPDEIFDTYVRTFAGINAGPYASVSIPGGAVSGIGQRVTFTMKPLHISLFQPPFQVEAIRYSPSQRVLSVRTINPVHPLFGWRYWRVFSSANGITIETGAYDRPASGALNYIGSFVAREDQTGLWREYMQFILQQTGAVLRSSTQLMNGVWDADSNIGSAAVAPNATRQHILTQICGVAPTNIPLFELTGSCQ